MTLHKTTFEYLQPTDVQIVEMGILRAASRAYIEVVEKLVPEGPDRDHVVRLIRTASMWANVSITRDETGAPRPEETE